MGFFSWLWSGVKKVAAAVWKGIVAVGKAVVKVVKDVWQAIKPLIAKAARWIADNAMAWVEKLLPKKLKWLAGVIRVALYWIADQLEAASDEETVVQFLQEIERILGRVNSAMQAKTEIQDFEEYARFTTARELLGHLRERLVKAQNLDTLDQDDVQMVRLVKEIVEDQEREGTADELDAILYRKGQRNVRAVGMEQLFALWAGELKQRERRFDRLQDAIVDFDQQIAVAEESLSSTEANRTQLHKLKADRDQAVREKETLGSELIHFKLVVGVAEGLLNVFEELEADEAVQEQCLRAANLLYDWHMGKTLSKEDEELLEDVAVTYIPQAFERARRLRILPVNV